MTDPRDPKAALNGAQDPRVYDEIDVKYDPSNTAELAILS